LFPQKKQILNAELEKVSCALPAIADDSTPAILVAVGGPGWGECAEPFEWTVQARLAAEMFSAGASRSEICKTCECTKDEFQSWLRFKIFTDYIEGAINRRGIANLVGQTFVTNKAAELLFGNLKKFIDADGNIDGLGPKETFKLLRDYVADMRRQKKFEFEMSEKGAGGKVLNQRFYTQINLMSSPELKSKIAKDNRLAAEAAAAVIDVTPEPPEEF